MKSDRKDRIIRDYDCRKPCLTGFTLVELIVTIALLGVLITLVVPGLSGFVAESQSWRTTNQQQSLLAFVRSEAVRCSCRVVMCNWNGADKCAGNSASGTVRWSKGALVYADLDRDKVLDTVAEPVLRVLEYDSDVSVEWNRGERLIYEGDGSVLGGSNGTFTLSRTDADVRKLVISMTGRVRRD